MPNLSIELASDHSLLVIFGECEDLALHTQVRTLWRSLRDSPIPGTLNLHPGYATLLIDYDPLHISPHQLAKEVTARGQAQDSAAPASRLIEIPVSYGGEHGPDLEAVATHCGLPPEEVITRHSAAEYRVYFLGFSPGYPYLVGLDPALATPRLATPRKLVPAGSVGIGGSQAGIYPMTSPGGWRIIGHTSAPLFDMRRDPPALLEMGDRVRFRRIS